MSSNFHRKAEFKWYHHILQWHILHQFLFIEFLCIMIKWCPSFLELLFQLSSHHQRHLISPLRLILHNILSIQIALTPNIVIHLLNLTCQMHKILICHHYCKFLVILAWGVRVHQTNPFLSRFHLSLSKRHLVASRAFMDHLAYHLRGIQLERAKLFCSRLFERSLMRHRTRRKTN